MKQGNIKKIQTKNVIQRFTFSLKNAFLGAIQEKGGVKLTPPSL